jgi:hypothetical protein
LKNILIVGAVTFWMLSGCGSKDMEPKQEEKQIVQEVEPKVEEPKFKKNNTMLGGEHMIMSGFIVMNGRVKDSRISIRL